MKKQKSASDIEPVAVTAGLLLEARRVRLCVQCGREFTPSFGHRKCCSDKCQKVRELAGSVRGGEVVRDWRVKERAKMAMLGADGQAALGV